MNAVIYARYSSHGQTEQSIEGQLRDCYEFAKREGLTVVGECIDRALTSRNDDRPDFQRMISDAAKKRFQYIVVYKLDRFARNRFDSAYYKHVLKKNGVKVISATERISDDPEGVILEGVIESLAEYYSANLSQNVRRGQRESVLKGSYIDGVSPFGFKSVTDGEIKKLVSDDEKAPIIRYVFEQYAKGVTKKRIMEALSAKGVLNYNGRPLTLSCLQHALRNTRYIGKYIYNGQEVAGACEALIDEETFNKVQKILDVRSHGKSGGKSRQEYLLQGKAYCGHCGARLVGDSGTSHLNAVYYYYACGKRKKHRACDKKNEKKAFLKWYVAEQTVEYVLRPDRIEYIASRIVEKYEDEFNDRRIKEYERQIAKLKREVDNIIDAIAKGGVKAVERLIDKIETPETQKEDIEHELVIPRIANGNRYTHEQIVVWLNVFTRGDPLDPEFQRRIIDVFINSVYVYDDKLVIYYNVQGGNKFHT
ncbi:MAG: recombinase family protein [Clostridiales bacterium]|jgi:DNA invertase Pin-like site-specific DNA recombinase|nr:recombinase family protein [Clostridiales bacterium]